MKLSDFFSSSFNKINDGKEQTSSVEMDAVGKEQLSRQIKALTPGKVIRGEVIAKNGSEVKIKLPGDLVMTARLTQDVNVEEGRTITFEVKNNGTTLTLSPLFANTANTDNLYKALQMASIPINQTTVSMTEQMMQQGMSIDSKSLQGMFRDVTIYPSAEVENIVQLHKLAVPVTEESLAQMESYKALTHELVRGMTDVLEALPEGYATVLASGGEEKAVSLYQDVIQTLLPETGAEQAGVGTGFMQAEDVGPPNGAFTQLFAQLTEELSALTNAEDAGEDLLLQNGSQPTAEEILTGNKMPLQTEGESVPGNISSSEGTAVSENTVSVLGAEAQTSQSGLESLSAGQLLEALSKSGSSQQFLQLLAQAPVKNSAVSHVLSEIFQSQPFAELLKQYTLKQWTIEPESVDGREVDEVYTRLARQLTGMHEALQSAGAGESSLKSVANLRQNLDFMNQMNQLYTYVQLPLSMNGRQANGELYVFTNKRSLAKSDGALSALLHLDMEHLGPLDVYVAMQNGKVNTRFTVQDDAMLDFLNDHMDILTERLEKKGYELSCQMQVRDEKEDENPQNPIGRILQQDENRLLVQYGFDMRA